MTFYEVVNIGVHFFQPTTISGGVGMVVNNTTKKLRRFRGDLLIGCLPFDVETRDGKKVRGGHGETLFFEINVNSPSVLARGRNWSDGNGQFYTQPERTGEFGGMPVYSRVNEYYPATVENPAIVIAARAAALPARRPRAGLEGFHRGCPGDVCGDA